MTNTYDDMLEELMEEVDDQIQRTATNSPLQVHSSNPTGYSRPEGEQAARYGTGAIVLPSVGRTPSMGGGQPGVPRPQIALGNSDTGETVPLDLSLVTPEEIEDISNRCGGPGQKATKTVLSLAVRRRQEKLRNEKRAQRQGAPQMNGSTPLPAPQPFPQATPMQSVPSLMPAQPNLHDTVQPDPPARPVNQPQPQPQAQPQLPPQPQQMVAQKQGITNEDLFSATGIPFLGVVPSPPEVPVIWDMGHFGQSETYYHGVLNQAGSVVIIYDTRFPAQAFLPSKSAGAEDVRNVTINGEAMQVYVLDIKFQVGYLLFQVLNKVSPPSAPIE